MSYEKVSQATDLVIGTKQTLKALEQEEVLEVVIAKDAEPRVVNKVEAMASVKQIPIIYVDSMKKLGKACGIDVGAATVALKK
ncbi:50S ribosomal protein L7ae-like protein [Halalkalibacterium halodurans]|jgi:large subunit ribosomal protein L7A|uniref:RNA-binding protein BH0128 n=2 Tax=Halalkalibacterium halodurans TaxID=86665 RepID=RXL7_HALH5|nr:50S ribosomal protein L7ae-like protein [Halalkalibacterium halodurans]Q9Z9M0.1 RecName: Full=RNA-binding protein BH0128; AltName: Full=Putative ribosomal protein L7Ae-like; AltName: Full=Ribosomal protein eL8-like [Halalkalibacterium halodurans C-125]MDY7220628.1 50S ribosomal protein L7ae-like protein [Halalkalibacterium halodurans]MDY7239867.1 50S ribosomal protein L7ae-like protein [Halalkalibacterium halodurans]MED3647899.1 50S ribosomal protein L7ae-like protein [Halalkalibacterium hal